MPGMSALMRLPRRSSGLKFYIDPPYNCEPISSAVERAGREYCLSKESLLKLIYEWSGESPPSQATIDWDNPPEIVRKALMYAFDMSEATFLTHTISDGARWLRPGCRYGACVMCFAEDLRSGVSPHFRIEWASTFRTFCKHHRCPLYHWPRSTQTSQRVQFTDAYIRERYERVRSFTPGQGRTWAGFAISARLIAWESSFEISTEDTEDPRRSPSKRVRNAAELVMLLGTVRTSSRGRTPAGRFDPRPVGTDGYQGGWQFLCAPLRSAYPDRDSWDAFRSCGVPSIRRAAYFLTAAGYERDWPLGHVEIWPWFGNLKSRSADFWHVLVRSRFGDFPRDQARIDSLALETGIPGYWPVARKPLI